jgi:trehalose/maltose transport system permease protein
MAVSGTSEPRAPSQAAPKTGGGKQRAPTGIIKREGRLAFWLLLPTFLVLITVAFYPLISVFFLSFTNTVFASAEPSEIVGFDNYRQLLSMTVKQLPPEIDETTGQPVVDPETGEVDYESPVRVLPREPMRFREVTTFSLFGNQYVLGATDPDFIRAIWDTIVFTITSVAFEVVLGMIVALVVNRAFRGRGAMRAIMLVPWAIPTAVSSRLWAEMFASDRTGVFNVIFETLGIGSGQIPFLQIAGFQVWAMVIIDVWKTTSFMALLILAGLQTIPADIYEAASVDGANKVTQFFRMTLPMLRGTLAVALIFRTLDALRVFDLFQIVLAQSRYSMATFTYYELINNRAAGYSSASSVVIFIIILIFALGYVSRVGVRES